MACCHSLTVINDVLCGDPLDLIVFEQSGWTLKEITIQSADNKNVEDWSGVLVSTSDGRTKLKCLKQFTFSSQLKRMSVIAQNTSNGQHWIYCKGAPETIADLCVRESVPKDCKTVLNYYAKHGYRVLALSCRRLEKLSDLKEKQENLECNMTFLGLIIFENRLKPQTTAVIQELSVARIRTAMITGDNLLTAISVAKECGILDSLRPIHILEANLYGDKLQLKMLPTAEDKPLSPRLSIMKSVPLPIDLEKALGLYEAHHADYQVAIEGK